MDAQADLNDPQARAVAHVKGPLLVFAGAGSGKTRVITYRVANLVARHRVPPYRILAVTFTNKAAGEMRARLARLLPPGMDAELWVGTFHAICARLLRRHAEAVGLSRSFVIYDTSDQKSVMTRVVRGLDLDEKQYPPKVLLGRVHKEKQEGRGPDDMSLDSYFDEKVHRAYAAYEKALRAANAVDFEDLILHVVRLVEGPGPPGGEARPGLHEAHDPEMMRAWGEARDALRAKFDHALVDEFQDTNAIQYRLIRGLLERTRNLCVVGDDDQSIYRWRGADIRNIRNFRRDWPDATVVKLEQNYRSTARIVAGALAIIKPAYGREPKELWTDNEQGTPIYALATADERDEGAEVVRMIRDARAQGIAAADIAVFYRVHAQSRVLEEALRAVKQPYQIIGGTRFYERAEIKDAIAYLRLLVNPRSDVDFLRVVNVPPRGLGGTTVERLVAFATAEGVPLLEALARVDRCEDIKPAARKRLGQLRQLLSLLAEESAGGAPATVLRSVLARTGYRAALEADDGPEAEARLENLGELESSMVDYADEAAARGEEPTLVGFLERVSLLSDTDGLEGEKVTLMTVHGAKGLEFDLVIVTGAEEDLFPYKSLDAATTPEEMDEERRLGYVAVTRARKHLVLTHAKTRLLFGSTRVGRMSRFIQDLPPELVIHRATQAALARTHDRYVDRAPLSGRGHGVRAPREAPSWRPPRSSPPAVAREPGERYVERDDDAEAGEAGELDVETIRRGTRVHHARFGDGVIREVLSRGEPSVVAFFPGWGEKKVLTRYLRPAGS